LITRTGKFPVNRGAVYLGAEADAIAAGTVNVPRVFLGGNGQGIFAYLTSGQVVVRRESATLAIRNLVFLRVALACYDS
jgi:hypothetical protein